MGVPPRTRIDCGYWQHSLNSALKNPVDSDSPTENVKDGYLLKHRDEWDKRKNPCVFLILTNRLKFPQAWQWTPCCSKTPQRPSKLIASAVRANQSSPKRKIFQKRGVCSWVPKIRSKMCNFTDESGLFNHCMRLKSVNSCTWSSVHMSGTAGMCPGQRV